MSTGAPNETGTPIRMPSVALLCIDSADGVKTDTNNYVINDATPSTITINKQAPLMFGYMTRIALTEINFAWATPNVNDRNNTLTYEVGVVSGGFFVVVGTYRVALSNSFHTPAELATSLEIALNNVIISPGEQLIWAVNYIPRESYFSLDLSGSTSTTQYYYRILPPGKTYTINGTATDQSSNDPVFTGRVDDDLTYMMGLTQSSQIANTFFTEVRSGFASCQYTPYVDIVSSILTKNQNVHDNDSSIRNGQSKLARIYLSHPGAVNQFTINATGTTTECNIVGVRPFVIHREFQTPKVISWNTTENVDIVDLQVLDHRGYPIFIEQRVISSDEGNVLVLGNTASFQFTLQITET
jgi:hypothetical protein